MTLLVFILILSTLVLIHEFGHFITAKIFGVRVDEFGLGLPPKVFGKKFGGDTEYTFNLLPFGGFVKLYGEDQIYDEGDEQKIKKDPTNFNSIAVWKRMLIVGAGIIMNLVLTLVLYFAFLAINGFSTFNLPLIFDYDFAFGQVTSNKTVITGVYEETPAETAGFESGEAITHINGQPVISVDEIAKILTPNIGTPVEVTVKDLRLVDDASRTVMVTPILNEETQKGILGVSIGETVQINYSNNKLLSAGQHAYNMFSYTMFVMKELVSLSFETRSVAPVSQSVSGPVGIYSIVGAVLSYGDLVEDPAQKIKILTLSLLDLTALLSLSLAFMNLLPLPALDGGRLVFLTIEQVWGSRVHPKYESYAHQIGLVLLLGLIILVSIKDVLRFF